MDESPREAATRLSAAARAEGFKPTGFHPYVTPHGKVIYWRLRLKHPDGRKWIRPMHVNGQGFVLTEPTHPPEGKPLYALDRVAANQGADAWIFEGEQKADAANNLGLVATTSGSAMSADGADWSPLKGRACHIWADNDSGGQKYANEVTRALTGLGCRVDRIDVAQLGLGEAEDVIDWLAKRPGAIMDDIKALPRCVAARAEGASSADESKQGNDPPVREFPKMDALAFAGLPGEVVKLLDPHTESDPTAILLNFLVFFGNALGRAPRYRVEGTDHYANLFCVQVGDSSKARKGTAADRVRQILRIADPEWANNQIHSGLSSGEGVIHACRDSREDFDEGGAVTIVDRGVADKRLMVIESEFAGALKVMQREGNILSRVLRDAWDRGDLATLTKQNPGKATGAHVSIIAHITYAELQRQFDRTEMANGFGNRFMFACVRRSKELPFGGNLPTEEITGMGYCVGEALKIARPIEVVSWKPDAAAGWREIYHELSESRPGLLGSLTARAEAQIIRIAMVYALCDGKAEIDRSHLGAAVAVWRFCEASVAYLFGDTLGDPVADTILKALRAASQGLTRTEIAGLFSRNTTASQIVRALGELAHSNLARWEKLSAGGSGRPAETWFAKGRL